MPLLFSLAIHNALAAVREELEAGEMLFEFLDMPHSQSALYSAGHDGGMRKAMRTILGRLPGDAIQKNVAERIATLPMRLGGLGLRSAARTAPATYWASWADAMPMLSRRLPELTTHIIDEMARVPQGCLAELSTACACLDRSGFISRPMASVERG